MQFSSFQETLFNRLDLQKRNYQAALTNAQLTIQLFKETVQESEEKNMKEEFSEMDKILKDIVFKDIYLMKQEILLFDGLMAKLRSLPETALDDFDMDQWMDLKLKDWMNQFTTNAFEKQILKDEDYIDFLTCAWTGRFPKDPFHLKKAYQVLVLNRNEYDPLPDSDLFHNDHNNNNHNNNDVQEKEEDEELEMLDAQISFICPITQQLMDEIWTSKVCKHSYSSAIRNILNSRNFHGNAECPVAGCNKYVSLSALFKDKPMNRALLKKQEELALGQNENQDDDDEYMNV